MPAPQQSTAAPITTPPRSPVCLHAEDAQLAACTLHLLQGAPQLPGISPVCAAVSNAVEQPGEVFPEVVTFLDEIMSSSFVCAGRGDR